MDNRVLKLAADLFLEITGTSWLLILVNANDGVLHLQCKKDLSKVLSIYLNDDLWKLTHTEESNSYVYEFTFPEVTKLHNLLISMNKVFHPKFADSCNAYMGV